MSILSRFSFGLRFRWILLLLLLVGAVAVGFLLYPRIGGPGPDLRLVAIGEGGEFRDSVAIPAAWAAPAMPRSGAVARFPLILGVVNEGPRPASPTRLALSLPARYRLVPSNRSAVRYHEPGSPLARYLFAISPGLLRAGRLPSLLPGLDTLWIEPILPDYDCTVLADSVPEFIAAPAIDAATLARIRIFYRFGGGGLRGPDQTGLLEVQLDPAQLDRPAPPPPPSFPVSVSPDGIRLPDLGQLKDAGSRLTECGEPESPYRLLSTVWETPAGGRMIVLEFGGVPRKYLLDLNRDSIVEYEMWDPDGDGTFEIGRQARFPIPAYLIPEPPPPPVVPDSLLPDSLRVDSAAFDSLGRPVVPVRPPATTTPPPAAAPARPAPRDTGARPLPTPVDTQPPPVPVDTQPPPPVPLPIDTTRTG